MELAILEQLAEDGRRSASRIAEATGYSTSGVTRAIRHIMGASFASFRVESDLDDMGCVYAATLCIAAPHRIVDDMGMFLKASPRVVRECTSVIGRANFYVHSWVTSIDELDRLEESLLTHFPAAQTIDRYVTMSFIKRAGHLLRPDGTHDRYIPYPRR